MTVEREKANPPEGEDMVSLRLNRKLRERLEREAEKNDRTLSAEIRQAIKAHLAKVAA